MAEQQKVELSVTPEFKCYAPGGLEKCWATATLRAPFFEPTTRAEIDLVAVIDRSGSMSGSKIKLVKETLEFVIDQLKENDRFSLVSYSSDVRVDIPLTKMTKKNKESTKTTVNLLQATGSTALCGGLIKGMQQILHREATKAQVASVLLFTDGQANSGPSTKEGILAAMQTPQVDPEGASHGPAMRIQLQQVNAPQRSRFNPFNLFSSRPSPPLQQQAGPPPPPPVQQQAVPPPPPPAKRDVPSVPFEGTIYTFGFGADHTASLLEAIATAGDGSYYFIENAEKIPESFADCLGGLLSVVGQNIELTLEGCNGAILSGVHAKKPPKMSQDKAKCSVELGDLQSEEERDVVMELTLPASGEPVKDCKVVLAKLNYFNVITSMMEEATAELLVHREQAGVQQANASVLIQKTRISAVQALKEAKDLGEKGDLARAREILKKAIADIEKGGLTEENLIKFLLKDLKDILESYASDHVFRAIGSKKAANVFQSNVAQRSQTSADNAYVTKSKSAMKTASVAAVYKK